MNGSGIVVRDDPQQQAFTARYQARTLPKQILYLALHLVPGGLAYLLINVPVVHDFIAARSPLPDALLQGAYIIAITVGWHLLVPPAMTWPLVALLAGVRPAHALAQESLPVDALPSARQPRLGRRRRTCSFALALMGG